MTNRTQATIVGLGELLWDVFPDHSRCLGGAPANVAYHAAVLGDRGVVASCIGQDDLGEQAARLLADQGVIAALQRVPQRATGIASVSLVDGKTHFQFDANSAWFYPRWDDDWCGLLARADVLCFGTLFCFQPAGRLVIEAATAALPQNAWRLLDLNLRPPFFDRSTIGAALACANAVKLNQEEVENLGALFGIDSVVQWLIDTWQIRQVAVTLGDRGSCLYSAEGSAQRPAVLVAGPTAGDPVGAGDAFTAVLAHALVRRLPMDATLAAANCYAGFVASCTGAMPLIPPQIRAQVLELLR